MDRTKITTETVDHGTPKGRILRVKLGYNPNSSSIGTIVFAMPAALLGSMVAFGAVAGLLSSAVLQRTGGGAEADGGRDGEVAGDDEVTADGGAGVEADGGRDGEVPGDDEVTANGGAERQDERV